MALRPGDQPLADLARELLQRMKRIRAVEEEIAARYAEGKMRCPTHLSVGQEAVGAAVGLALRQDDFVVSSHRAHAHYLGKGGNLRRMLAEIYGKVDGCSKGKGGSMHLIDRSVGFLGSTAIVANTIPIGVGLGLSIQLHGTQQVSCVFFGDAAVEEGAFAESVNFAVLRRLPVLFICENNLYSVYSPLRVRQPPGREIFRMVEAMGLPAWQGDGNDASAVFHAAHRALEDIRGGGGPRFLEFMTYRWREHCGPNVDNDLGYRSSREVEEWKQRDPIGTLERRVLDDGRLTSGEIGDMERAIREEIVSAFAFAEESPFPDQSEAFSGVYRTAIIADSDASR